MSAEFKHEAAQLVVSRGVSVAQASRHQGIKASRHLDLDATVLRRWVREFGSSDRDAFPGKGHLRPEDEDLGSLRPEVATLKAERDIIEKAAAH